MAIATYAQLRGEGGVVAERRVKLARSLAEKDLFLSYSHKDAAHVRPALGLLEQHGANVYVDLQDGGIKGLAGSDIAARLRQTVRRCRRLVVIVSDQTGSSRWIPWEMGLADGIAGSDHVALLPLRPGPSASTLWLNQKYFDLYARIERVTLEGERCWGVRDPSDGKYWRLERWIEITKRRLSPGHAPRGTHK